MEQSRRRLGFGCMRLPMVGGPEGEVDQVQFQAMVDRFLEAGFTYFDTAIGYLHGKSEPALRTGLVERYPRGAYTLTDKLTASFFEKEEDIRPLVQRQLERTGVDYFDCYLLHSVNGQRYEEFLARNAFEVVRQLREEGKIRRMGISFHDSPAQLARILEERPEIEVVQIQLNYADFDDPVVESGGVYQVCRQYGKPVLVMEPVKGGKLADLPPEGAEILRTLGGGSPAAYALRYAASFPGVEMVLSGMSTLEQMEDNLSYMMDFRPLDERELAAIDRVRQIFRSVDLIPCTACRYCVAGCPRKILIPDLFAAMNAKKMYRDWNSDWYYMVHTQNNGKASDCIKCGKCEQACPQHLKIRELLEAVSQEFDRSAG